MITSRRAFIGGLTALFAAPALVRADSLMKIRGAPLYFHRVVGFYDIGIDQLFLSVQKDTQPIFTYDPADLRPPQHIVDKMIREN